MSNSINSLRAQTTSAQLRRYLPRPQSSGLKSFGEVLKAAGSIGTRVLNTTAGGAFGGAIGGDFMSLIDQQMKMQTEMQQVTMLSNIERSQHESKMAPIRNIRLS